MRKLKKLEITVKEILKNDELSSKLYPNEIGKKFETVMFHAKNKGISFESITRCRRKLQEKNPELRDEETVKNRNKKQKEYIKYSVEN